MEDRKMKKVTLLLLSTLLIVPMLCQIRIAHAVSSGYEIYEDDKCEIYLEYFPTVPYDAYYLTASEEFPIKFSVFQDHWYENLGLTHLVPAGFTVDVAWRDVTANDSDAWPTWKKWYPISVTQYGSKVTWTLGGSYGPLTVAATIEGQDMFAPDTDYSKYPIVYGGEAYEHLGGLDIYYDSSNNWASATTEGAGSIGIPNDLAAYHDGHHVKILVTIHVYWINYAFWPYQEDYEVNFVLGDDTPSDTDCWLTVEQGNTGFSIHNPIAPACAMKTNTNGYFYVPSVATDLLKIEMLFNNSNLAGDQTGGTPPYSSIGNYPDGSVDMADVSFISDKYMCTEGSSGWDYMADVVPDKSIDMTDVSLAIDNFFKSGTYTTDLAGVTVTFNTGEPKSPDSDGFVTIPQGATSFTVKRNGTPIGAMIFFW
jgi:hypothetical protein